MINLKSSTTPSSVSYVTVSNNAEGQRIDNFLINHLKGVPKSLIYKIVRKGEVRVNKGRVKPCYRVKENDLIRVPPVRVGELSDKELILPKDFKEKIISQILYEDEALLILNKPAGMAVHGGSGLSFGVIEALRQVYPQHKNLELVHRLDKETSGCLMIAKKRSMLKLLHEMLRVGQIKKEYLALVNGDWAGELVKAPLLKNQLQSGERIVKVDEEGQPSQTLFKLEKKFKHCCLMRAFPITGRTHQIRVHANFAQHPIAFDMKYGDKAFNVYIKTKELTRLFLHAQKLTIPLPDQPPLVVEAKMDSILENCLNNLSKENLHA
ncbi:MAG: rRNA pseudouridylate synthase [Francisellaceae bacterium]|nr:rRNA pseudouridylate synthase [Francisellaceae bacterium]